MTKHISPSLVASLPFHQDRQALLTYSDVVLPPSAFLTLSLLQTFKTYSNKQTLKKTEKIRQKANKATNVHESCD
jgi:Na+-translocating ferredoxin:NAD+ oxidoreductase RnfE subunit